MSTRTLAQKEWIEIGEAARMMGCSLSLFKRRGPDMGIRFRILPGCIRRKVHLGDLTRVLVALERAKRPPSAGHPNNQQVSDTKKGRPSPGEPRLGRPRNGRLGE